MPAPVADRGGLRVDTGSESELSRWVFSEASLAITALTTGIQRPGHVVKLAGPRETLAALLAPGWRIESENQLMTRDAPAPAEFALPPGYRWIKRRQQAVTHLRIVAADGLLAASGHVAQARGAFVYDRILTAPDHRRRGLGAAMMARLATFRTGDAREVLTATPAGRALYLTLGWREVCAWSTAVFAGD